MTEAKKHTETPWILEDNGTDILILETGGGNFKHDYDCVAIIYGNCAQGNADAAFIVTACNAHEALTRAMEDMLKDFERDAHLDSYKAGVKALVLAKGE